MAPLGVWRARGRWIESSDSGLTSSWGQSVDFDKIKSLDKRKWRNKGIARSLQLWPAKPAVCLGRLQI